MIKCPVCPANNIGENTRICPGCGADLSPIHKLRELATTYYNDALRMAKIGAIENAISQVMAALAIDRQFAKVRLLLGKLLWKKKLHREAIAQWQEAMAITPEEKETKNLLETAEKQLKIKMIRNVTAIAVVIIIFILVAFVPFYLYFKASGEQMQQIENNNLNLTEQLHFLQQKHAQLTSGQFEQMQQIKNNNINLTEQLHLLQQKHTQLTSGQFEQMQQQLNILKNQQKNTTSTLAVAIETNRKQIADTKAEVKLQQQKISNALVPLFESLRPANFESLTTQIRTLQERLVRLRNLEQKFQSRDLFIIDPLAINNVRGKIKKIQIQLKSLQAEYDVHIVPWQQGLKMIKILAGQPPTTELTISGSQSSSR